MRVCLVNEGTYPYYAGGVSTWCDLLIRSMPEVKWDLVTVVGDAPERPGVALPANVRSLVAVPVWGPPRPARVAVEAAVAGLCRGMLGEDPADLATFGGALRSLAEAAVRPAPASRLWLPRPRRPRSRPEPVARHTLAGVAVADALLDAWAAARAAGSPLGRLTLGAAEKAAALLEHAVRPLAAVVPSDVDLVHANANGLSSLVAMAAKWRANVPFLMTEHGVYLRERYLAAAGQPPGVKTVLLRFHRALARLAYAEADSIAPVNAFNSRWAVRHGACADKVEVIGNGVDPARFPPLEGEPEHPVISWVGRIDPLKDVQTLIRSLAVVRGRVPDARLHLAGPVPPGNEEYARQCRDLVADLGLQDAVEFAGPVRDSREAFAAGQLSVLSSVSEGMPYTLLEAMICGRPTVSTDVGGVAETVGDTGIIVPPRDPGALGTACADLLTDPGRRAALAASARARALRSFTVDRCAGAYLDRYQSLVTSKVECAR